MLCVKRLTLREIRLRLREPFRISSGQMQDRRILILELEDVDGVIAWSECVAGEQPNYSPETIDTAWLAIARWLARKVLNVSFSHPAQEYAVTGWRRRRLRWDAGGLPVLLKAFR